MTAFSDPVVHESDIPIAVLYNDKIEYIRLLECEKQMPPLAIHFDISESFSGSTDHRLITLQAESYKTPFHIDIDLLSRDNAIYETKLEKINRSSKFKKFVPLELSDYLGETSDKKAVARFVVDLQK